jgi:hypothetical protein
MTREEVDTLAGNCGPKSLRQGGIPEAFPWTSAPAPDADPGFAGAAGMAIFRTPCGTIMD